MVCELYLLYLLFCNIYYNVYGVPLRKVCKLKLHSGLVKTIQSNTHRPFPCVNTDKPGQVIDEEIYDDVDSQNAPIPPPISR